MRKILGTKKQYYIQTNNAQVELFKDYFGQKKYIACGPTAVVMCLDIAGWPMEVFTPGEQPEDSILMIAHNPNNLKKIKERRELDYDKYPPNEVPQVYEVVCEIIYGVKNVCKLGWGLTYTIIKNNILQGKPMVICGKFPAGGHYVSCVGFDDEKGVIIYNDPYPDQWQDKKGYNREMTIDYLNKMFKWRIDFKVYDPLLIKYDIPE